MEGNSRGDTESREFFTRDGSEFRGGKCKRCFENDCVYSRRANDIAVKFSGKIELVVRYKIMSINVCFALERFTITMSK